MEIKKGGQTLMGFPGADRPAAMPSPSKCLTSPRWPPPSHRAGLRRLFALQIKDALKYLEKNIPDLQKMAVAYMPLGTQEELRAQIIDVALDRAFLQTRCPPTRPHFKRRVTKAAAA